MIMRLRLGRPVICKFAVSVNLPTSDNLAAREYNSISSDLALVTRNRYNRTGYYESRLSLLAKKAYQNS